MYYRLLRGEADSCTTNVLILVLESEDLLDQRICMENNIFHLIAVFFILLLGTEDCVVQCSKTEFVNECEMKRNITIHIIRNSIVSFYWIDRG